MDSVDPIDSKLTVDTWFYVKRCLLSHLFRISTLKIVPISELTLELILFLQRIDELQTNVTIRKESRLLQFAYYKTVMEY